MKDVLNNLGNYANRYMKDCIIIKEDTLSNLHARRGTH